MLREGGLVAFPTETVYGVGASALHDDACRRLIELKGLVGRERFTLHVPDADAALRFADTGDATLRRIVHKLLPGPVTMVIELSDEVIEARSKQLGLADAVRDRIYHGGLVSVRCPEDRVARALLGAAGVPVVAVSASVGNASAARDAGEASASLGDRVSLVIDGGPSRYAKPSTVVRLSANEGVVSARVERSGVLDERFVQKMLRWTMLIVCSGNTCRSPMAEGLARKMLAETRRTSPDELDRQGIRVASAGAFAMPGMPATAEAIEAARKLGADISRHRSRPLTLDMLHEADVIYCMTDAHRHAVIDMLASAESRTHLLDPGGRDVEDPIGSGPAAYQKCAEFIRAKLAERIEELKP